MAPRVSVIIPAYNAARYVEEAVRSVLAQTYTSFEIIVVDDGSTDGTPEVLDRLGASVKLLRKANGGPASARNLGMAHAAGEYFAFLDSDDLWVSDKLERQVAVLDARPEVGLLFGEAEMFVVEDGVRTLRGRTGHGRDVTFCSLLFSGNCIPNLTVLFRRRCFEVVGGMNEKLLLAEDYEYWMRIARRFRIAGVAEPVAYYRLHGNNLLGDGRFQIDKELRSAQSAIAEVEALFPGMWSDCGLDRRALFARMHVRAAKAWRQRGDWNAFVKACGNALAVWPRLRVLRWIVAAFVLRRWA